MATSRVYTLFQNITPEESQAEESNENEEKGEFAYEDKNSHESVLENQVKREQKPKKAQDIKDLFNAWNNLDDDDSEPDDLQGAEAWTQSDIPEQPLEAGDTAFSYDEWDRELNDYRVGWCRVIEKKVRQGDRNFVELARSRYRGVISSIRHQFQLMKPENLTRINREIDGEDYDLNALVEYVIDRRADGQQSENIYTKRLRKQRDVAVSILLDQSSSTARTITRNPLQPYTHPGRRIIEIEKEGLVLMSEALEAVGDVYSINGFTSEGRRNVKFYVVKDFDEKYSEEIERQNRRHHFPKQHPNGRGNPSRGGKTSASGIAHQTFNNPHRRQTIRSRLRRRTLCPRRRARSPDRSQNAGHHAVLHHD